MKYAFIHRNRRVWPISVQCRVLRVSVAGYHEHFVRRLEIAQRRHLSDEALLVHIRAVYAAESGSLRLAAHLAGTAGPGHPRRQAAGATTDAAERHPGTRQAPFPDHDHRQPARSADCAQPPGSQLHRGRTQPGVGRRRNLHRNRRRMAVSGSGHGPVQPPHRRLVAARADHQRDRHRCPADGLVPTLPRPRSQD